MYGFNLTLDGPFDAVVERVTSISLGANRVLTR